VFLWSGCGGLHGKRGALVGRFFVLKTCHTFKIIFYLAHAGQDVFSLQRFPFPG
jgi:hypothetical protein